LTGTDEHGIKIQKTSAAQSMTPKELCDMNAQKFQEAWKALGVEYSQLTALHLAEYFSNCCEKKVYEAVLTVNGKRTLVEFEDLNFDSKIFNQIGLVYEESTEVQKYSIGNSTCYLLDYRSLIDFSTEYLKGVRQ
jgi:aminoglycoside N3'-acetyltransferase